MGFIEHPIPFMAPMLFWRRQMWRAIFVMALLLAIGVAESILPALRALPDVRTVCVIGFWVLGALAAGFWLVCVGFMFFYMFRAARQAADIPYAVKQLSLAIVLTPVLLLGVILVPLLVRADILAWRRHEESGKESP